MATNRRKWFHRRHGSLITLANNGRTASRSEPSQEFNNGLVISKRPLKENEIFEVRIDKKVVTWSGSIEVGVTSLDPSNLEFPASATQLCDGSWVLSGSTILHNGEAIVDEYNCDLDGCNIGDRVGVQRNSQGELHIYLNGEDRGVAATGIPSKVYAVIDLYGKCTEVTIVNADTSDRWLELEFSSDENDNDNAEDMLDDMDNINGCVEELDDNSDAEPMSNEALFFNRKHGSLIKLSGQRRTAERMHAMDEFNNGVVMTNRPLRNNEMFEIRIDKLIDKWSGSIEIGVTTHDPEALEFPATITNLRSGTVMMSGCGILTNGKGTRREYGEFNLDELVTGDQIGVMRKDNGDLHFFINGRDQGRAASDTADVIYGVVDLYGMAVQVSLLEHNPTTRALAADRRTANRNYLRRLAEQELPHVFEPPDVLLDWSDRLLFHPECGIHAEVINDGTTAHRPNALDDFNNAVVLSNRPLAEGEMFEIRIDKMVDKWAGSIEIGVTTHSPRDLDFPSTMTNVRSGTWMMTGNGIMHNGTTIVDEYGQNLDRLKVRIGDKIGVLRRNNGNLNFFISGVDQGIAATQVPAQLFAVVDLYGQAAQATIVDPTEHRAELTATATNSFSLYNSHDEHGALRFHHLHGKNCKVSNNGLMALRPNATGEFNDAIIMSNRPLKDGELFEIVIDKMVDRWSGSIEAGVTSILPEELDFPSTMTDMSHDTWMLSGAAVMRDGNTINNNYKLDLDTIGEGARIGMVRTSEGKLHFFLDGIDQGVACENVPRGVYTVIDLYGQCSQVTLKPPVVHDNHLSTLSLQDSLNSVLTVGTLKHKFYTPVHGANVTIADDGSTASRKKNFDNGVLFSAAPMKTGELFEIQIDKVCQAWSGSLCIGLTTFNPEELGESQCLPSSATALEKKTWLMMGPEIRINGQTKRENFAPTLERLQERQRVGVKRCSDSTMHVYLEGEDKGIACTDVPKGCYAVVDLYGVVEKVSITSKSSLSDVEPVRAPSVSSSSESDSEKEEESTSSDTQATFKFHFHINHGKNIKLTENKLTAERTASYNQAMVVSNRPLPRNTLFEIRVDKLNGHWTSSLKVGVVGLSPEKLNFPATASAVKKLAWIVQGDAVFHNTHKVRGTLGVSLDQLNEGSTVGIRIEGDGLRLFVDKKDYGIIAQELPATCYAVVDLYGQCEQITLVTEGLETGAQGGIDEGEREKASLENDLKENSPISESNPTPGCVNCKYYDQCLRVKASLGLPDGYFDANSKYNKCYCDKCCKVRGEDMHGTAGTDSRVYTKPFGWCKYVLRTPPRAGELNVFEQWNVAYHGTVISAVRPILDSGMLMLPGDVTLGGSMISELEGHFNDDRKPKGFNTKQIFVSPSMKYSGVAAYARPACISLPSQEKAVKVKVAFQVRIRPGSFQTGKQTIRVGSQANHPIDSHIDNNEIEWMTEERAAIVPVALLIKIEGGSPT